jgi:hypothetical protein
MNGNIKPSDVATLLGVIDPDANGTGDLSTGWIDMSVYPSLLALILVGDIASTGKVDAKFEQATSAAGAGAKDVTGKALTQLTQAGGDSNKQALINLHASELDVAGGFRFARLTGTGTTAGADWAAVVQGFHGRYQPGAHATTVDEVVG